MATAILAVQDEPKRPSLFDEEHIALIEEMYQEHLEREKLIYEDREPGVTVPSALKEGWKHYRDTDGYFTIDIPEEWTVVEPKKLSGCQCVMFMAEDPIWGELIIVYLADNQYLKYETPEVLLRSPVFTAVTEHTAKLAGYAVQQQNIEDIRGSGYGPALLRRFFFDDYDIKIQTLDATVDESIDYTEIINEALDTLVILRGVGSETN